MSRPHDCFNYESGQYELIDKDGYSYTQQKYVDNWDDSPFRNKYPDRWAEDPDPYEGYYDYS